MADNSNGLTHISLFTGIGGFDLAAGWAGFRTIAMCELDPFCQEVLKERFGAVADAASERLRGGLKDCAGEQSGVSGNDIPADGPILVPDIHDFDGRRFAGATLLTGGFPCQPFSHAGKRRGTDDDRHLWPEMLRVIAESNPRWVVAENVRGLISIDDGMVFEQVCLDLENEGYEVQAFVIPACSVNAPHRRDRVWIVAHDTQHARITPPNILASGDDERGTLPAGEPDSHAPDTSRLHGDGGDHHARVGSQCAGTEDSLREAQGVSGREGRQPSDAAQDAGIPSPQPAGNSWDIPWVEVASALCDVAYGLPADLDRYRDRWDKKVDRQKEKEFIYEDPDAPWFGKRYKGNNPYTYWRTKSLQAGGNAIVPQAAYQIIKGIAEIELSSQPD